MRRYTRFRHRPLGRRVAPSPEATRRHLAIIIALLAVCLYIAVLLAPDGARIERLLPLVTQPLALVLGYYFGRKECEYPSSVGAIRESPALITPPGHPLIRYLSAGIPPNNGPRSTDHGQLANLCLPPTPVV
ncbi:MAG: hypothetical protein ACJ8CR_07665 [Roseiflexaceae bacterium]